MCPQCNSLNTKVLNTWEASERELKKLLGAVPPGGAAKRRRRRSTCGARWRTTEYARALNSAAGPAPDLQRAFPIR